MVKIGKEAANQNQAGTVWRLDKWDDLQIHSGLLLFKKDDTSSFLWPGLELGRVWVILMFLQIMCLVAR